MEPVGFCKKIATSFLKRDKIYRLILETPKGTIKPMVLYEKNGDVRVAIVHGSRETIDAVRNGFLSLNPDWVAIITTPEYNGKPCLCIEITRNSKTIKKCYDVVEMEEDFEFDELGISFEVVDLRDAVISSSQ